MQMKSHRDLVVWQRSKSMVLEVYELSKGLPTHERYGLCSQLRRAAVSIPANIAEGHGRSTRRDYAHFTGIAYGSLMELETLLEICIDLKYVSLAQCSGIMLQLQEISRMLQSLRSKLMQ